MECAAFGIGGNRPSALMQLALRGICVTTVLGLQNRRGIQYCVCQYGCWQMRNLHGFGNQIPFMSFWNSKRAAEFQTSQTFYANLSFSRSPLSVTFILSRSLQKSFYEPVLSCFQVIIPKHWKNNMNVFEKQNGIMC